MRGSWNRKPPSGYEVLRIKFEDGKPAAFEPFLTGFLSSQAQEGEEGGQGEGDDRWTQTARLAGLAQAADGSLLLSDDSNGIVYRLAYTGDPGAQAQGGPDSPTNAEGADIRMLSEAGTPEPPATAGSGLAKELLESPEAGLGLSSEAFQDGEAIPDQHAAEGQNLSPALSWEAGPEGTRSYALVMEDPDAPMATPYVHWLLYNVPAGTRQLAGAIPGRPQLAQPDGALQGRNDHGSMGYFGPKPPRDDPPHHYHFQVFALDTQLDLPYGASRAELLNAMEGHVLATGNLVGTFER